jgi:hypothetical protein
VIVSTEGVMEDTITIVLAFVAVREIGMLSVSVLAGKL